MTAPMRRRYGWLGIGLVCALALGYWASLDAATSVQDAFRQHHATLLDWQAAAPVAFLLGFFAVFVLVSALTLPGGTPLCLLAGSFFGIAGGAAVLGLASTLGALLSFLAARHLGRERAQRLLGHRLQFVDGVLATNGGLRLFWLRVIPLVPFPVLNPLLGLSHLSTHRFLWPSLAGLTLTSVPYAWAGQSLGALLAGQAAWLPLAGACASMLLLWLLLQRSPARRAAEEPG